MVTFFQVEWTNAGTLRPVCRRRFLPRDAIHKRGLCRIAVHGCLSVTFVYCVKTAKDTCIVISYYGMRIGNRTKAFEWYNFQWPWTTLSDLTTRSIARPLCDSWASCNVGPEWHTYTDTSIRTDHFGRWTYGQTHMCPAQKQYPRAGCNWGRLKIWDVANTCMGETPAMSEYQKLLLSINCGKPNASVALYIRGCSGRWQVWNTTASEMRIMRYRKEPVLTRVHYVDAEHLYR